MKHLLKKGLAVLAALVVMLSALTVSTSAAASSSIAFSKQQLNIGETLTVTARFSSSSSDPMYGLMGYITYDPTVVEFVSGSDNLNLLTKGKIKVVLQSAGKTNLTETIKFKTLKVGKTAIAIEQFVYVNKDDQEKTLTGSSAVVNVVNPSTQASSNANLKNLIVSDGTLTPKFDPNVTSYSVTIKNSVTQLLVSTYKQDAKASVSVEGSKEMKVGQNKRVVVVTAEDGTIKRYTINITRLGPDGQQEVNPPTEEDEPLNDLIEVNVGDNTMYVVEDFADAELPKGFDVTEFALNGKTVPALSYDNYIVLMLRLPDNSDRAFYVYDSEGLYSELVCATVGGQNYYILPTNKVPEGYSAENDVLIGEVTVPAFRSDSAELSDFAVVYAMGPTGTAGYYNYDTVENTMQRLIKVSVKEETKEESSKTEEEEQNIVDAINKNFTELNTNGKIVVVTILAIIVLLFVAIIVLIIKIATSGRKDDDDEEDDALEDYEVSEGDIVGFEYVSVPEAAPVTEEAPVVEEPAPVNEETPATEETAKEAEPTEAEEKAEEAADPEEEETKE